jgi:N6-L-threonylcarbamoyladenine synthase
VLALESSADDTCAAIVDASRRIWSNVVVSQNKIHEGLGGIQPMVALRAHQRNMVRAPNSQYVCLRLTLTMPSRPSSAAP